MDVATFAGGSFFTLEACYRRIKGVKAVVNGYAGGLTTEELDYKIICYGTTGWA